MTDNPESGGGWQVTLMLDVVLHVPPFAAALSAQGGAVSEFEFEGGPRWRMTAHYTAEPDHRELTAAIAVAAASLSIEAPEIAIELLPAVDWVAEYRRATPPVTIGRFFIRPAHFDDPTPPSLDPIRLDAGLAFGTGEHATTQGCLLELERLAGEGLSVGRALDLGCGSAILAIAIARLWPDVPVTAADNDPAAVITAVENLADNGAAGSVTALESDGYAELGDEKFDLIAANILAGPLIAMAGELARHLSPDGVAVLSGLLIDQVDEVLAAHAAHGLGLLNRRDIGEWATLTVATTRRSRR
ncbi:MAG: 50S ribosomal protein L11 methyltransferase [Alphaproteobacteria bacterium]